MRYGYARVSTTGQSLDAQIQQLEDEGCHKVYSEKFTGTTKHRPIFNEVLDVLQAGDTLVVTKLDRFARNTREAIETIDGLFDKGIKVHVLNMGLVENTSQGILIFNIMSAFAQFERDMIVERTQEGKAIARQREDFVEGRPKKYGKKHIGNALDMLQTHSYKQVAELTGISVSTLARAKRKLKS